MKKVLLILLAMVFFASNSFALDVVRMKNGDVYRGEIVEQKFNEYIQIRSNGNEKRLKWEDVKETSKEETPKEEMVSERIQAGIGSGVDMATAGRYTLWITYGLTAAVCLATCKRTPLPLIPVIGPFLNMSKDNSPSANDALLLSGLIQTIGLVFILSGESQKRRHRKMKSNVLLHPVITKKGTMLSMLYRF